MSTPISTRFGFGPVEQCPPADKSPYDNFDSREHEAAMKRGYIGSSPRPTDGAPASAYTGPTCTGCGGYYGIHSKADCAGVVPSKDSYIYFLQREIEAAHAACDSSWRRKDGERTLPLAERIAGMRQMIDDYQQWLEQARGDDLPEPELTAEEERLLSDCWEPETGAASLIVTFIVGAIVGVFIAWGFLSLS